MSDNEGEKKGGGYRVEEASSGRAKCKGPKPCNGTPIGKGELRLGSLVDFRGNNSWAWRRWGCTTKKIIENMKKSFESASELDGFDEISEANQEKLTAAWESGEVADEDIPESARKPEKDDEEEEETAKPKKRTRKKKDDGDDEEAKPKKRGRKKKEEDDEDEPVKKKAPAKKTADKKAPAKKRATKKKTADTESDGENFGDEIEAISSEDEAQVTDDEKKKKKKKAAPKKRKAKKGSDDD